MTTETLLWRTKSYLKRLLTSTVRNLQCTVMINCRSVKTRKIKDTYLHYSSAIIPPPPLLLIFSLGSRWNWRYQERKESMRTNFDRGNPQFSSLLKLFNVCYRREFSTGTIFVKRSGRTNMQISTNGSHRYMNRLELPFIIAQTDTTGRVRHEKDYQAYVIGLAWGE